MRIILIFFIISLVACSESAKQKNNNSEIYTVKNTAEVQQLYYTGHIAPLITAVVTSPVEGVIVSRHFEYGEKIQANQLLFTLSSIKFITDYKSALTAYVKAKNDFDNAYNLLTEAKFLHKNELISDDDFKSKQNNFYGNQLALIQAQDALTLLMKQIKSQPLDLDHLTIINIDKVLHAELNTKYIEIHAPVAGMVLAASKNDEEIKKMSKGDSIKQGDTLGIIGNTEGLRVDIKVDEMTINQLKVGQKVLVSGVAFEDESLAGSIDNIDHQGEVSSAGMPTFPVSIMVPTLTILQKEKIHIGMSAKVIINIETPNEITIPLKALHANKNKAYVLLLNNKNLEMRSVMTGKTSIDHVVIKEGLRAGDKIVVPN